MLNIEKYKDEIKDVGIVNIALVNEHITHCVSTKCADCEFYEKEKCCADNIVDWLTAEYQPKGEE